MTDDQLQDGLHELLFGVRRSVRYHNRRRAFFDGLHRLTTALSVLLGSGTVMSILAGFHRIALVASGIVALLSAFDLVIGYSSAARLHWDLARRFIDLEKAIVQVHTPSDAQVREWTAARLTIEADEPPVLRVLDTLCHNELLRAMGYPRDQFKHVNFLQRWLAQFVDIGDQGIA